MVDGDGGWGLGGGWISASTTGAMGGVAVSS